MTKTIFDGLRKTYSINVKCNNCGEFSEISIPKGVTIESYLSGQTSECSVCGCADLEKYDYPKITGERKEPIRIQPIFENNNDKKRSDEKRKSSNVKW